MSPHCDIIIGTIPVRGCLQGKGEMMTYFLERKIQSTAGAFQLTCKGSRSAPVIINNDLLLSNGDVVHPSNHASSFSNCDVDISNGDVYASNNHTEVMSEDTDATQTLFGNGDVPGHLDNDDMCTCNNDIQSRNARKLGCSVTSDT